MPRPTKAELQRRQKLEVKRLQVSFSPLSSRTNKDVNHALTVGSCCTSDASPSLAPALDVLSRPQAVPVADFKRRDVEYCIIACLSPLASGLHLTVKQAYSCHDDTPNASSLFWPKTFCGKGEWRKWPNSREQLSVIRFFPVHLLLVLACA
jgi:hypothetical protein